MSWATEARKDMQALAESERQWQVRVVRRGYLFDHMGHPFKVPEDLWDIYQERYPELGIDTIRTDA